MIGIPSSRLRKDGTPRKPPKRGESRKRSHVFCIGCRKPTPYLGAKTHGPQKLWHCPACLRLAQFAELERELRSA